MDPDRDEGKEPAFAHPVERELARVFDAHGIAWEYEPHTFVLARHADGSMQEGFTPDFFLPEIGMYIECTVQRQPLTSRKSRKARKAREHAGIVVQILFRRDIERLAARWDLDRLARAADARDEPVRVPHGGVLAAAD